MGFSTKTWMPAARSWEATSWWVEVGVQTLAASIVSSPAAMAARSASVVEKMRGEAGFCGTRVSEARCGAAGFC